MHNKGLSLRIKDIGYIFMQKILLALFLLYVTALSAQSNHQAIINQLHVPTGFSLAVFADDVKGARSMALAENGVVFVGTGQEGLVYALQDSNADGKADKRYIIATDLMMPNGVAYRDGSLYVAEVNRITKYENILQHLSKPPAPVVVYDKLPSDPHHGWKYLRFGPDGKLYTAVGAPCNICLPKEAIYTSLVRMEADGSGFEIIAVGIRNTVGFDWQPGTKVLFFTDNGRDYLGDDAPADELNRWLKVGEHFGFPYYHAGDIADPDLSTDKKWQEFTAPVWKFKAHVAPLGARFYCGQQFPAEYYHQLFIAQHGSWNRSKPDGYRIALVKFNGELPVAEEVFIDGWLDKDDKVLGRPVDMVETDDGSLLVSDDQLGVVYRVMYKGQAGKQTVKIADGDYCGNHQEQPVGSNDGG
jgi:glucose/arabinose dehydrogenase